MAKILWLDDSDIILKGVQLNLETCGHKVTGVNKKTHAIEELSNGQFDLLVCDGNLSGEGDGADFAQRMQRDFKRNGRRTKVAICSSNEQSRREGLAFISKLAPNFSELVEQIVNSSE